MYCTWTDGQIAINGNFGHIGQKNLVNVEDCCIWGRFGECKIIDRCIWDGSYSNSQIPSIRALLQSLRVQSPLTALVWPISMKEQGPPVAGGLPVFLGQGSSNKKSTNLTNLSSLEWQRQSWVGWHRPPATWRCPCSVSSGPSAQGRSCGGQAGRRTRRSCTRSGSPAQSLTPEQLVCQSCLPPQMSEPENYLLHWFGRFTYWASHRRGDYSDMMCENLSFKRTLTEFDNEGEDYSPCKSNSNCPKSLRHHPLGRRLCTDGCPTLILTWYRN